MPRRLVLVLLVAALAGCAAPPPPPEGQGLMGEVTVGPTCPVHTWPPDPACADRPLATSFEVATSADGGAVATAESDAEGRFQVELESGRYWLRHQPGDNQLPSCPTTGPHTVRDGAFTEVKVDCDSGIR